MAKQSRTNEKNEASPQPPATVADREQANIMAEYQTLRADVLGRVQFRYQLINLILIVAGTFLSFGLSLPDGVAAAVLLTYPILALF